MNRLADGVLEIPELLNFAQCLNIIGKASLAGFSSVSKEKIGRYNQESFFQCSCIYDFIYLQLNHFCIAFSENTKIVKISKPFECYSYHSGDYISPHCDRAREIYEGIMSTHTLLIYLNENFDGGETYFLKLNTIKVSPSIGKAILFENSIIHEASKVTRGIKYVLRADIALDHSWL